MADTLPPAILDIQDPELKQRATEARRAACQLRRAMQGWDVWGAELERESDADPALAVDLYETVLACVTALCRLRVNLPPFANTSPAEIFKGFPHPPTGELQPVPWQCQVPYLDRLREIRLDPEWRRMQGDLFSFVQSLETAPSTCFLPLHAPNGSSVETGIADDDPAAMPAIASSQPAEKSQEDEGEMQDKTTDSILPQFLSAADIAKRVGRNPRSVKSFLTRYAQGHEECRIEIELRRQNEPAYLYRTADVWPALEMWLK